MAERHKRAWLVLGDGSAWEGTSIGAQKGAVGEVVFTTGMVGYVESLTDPSYTGQILAFTSPMIGNYGVPQGGRPGGAGGGFESSGVKAWGVIVSSAPVPPSHHRSIGDLGSWLRDEGVPGIEGIDTRALVTRLRSAGTMPGAIVHAPPGRAAAAGMRDTMAEDLVPSVSVRSPVTYGKGKRRVALVDCGYKRSILSRLLGEGLSVTVMPWDTPARDIGREYHGVVLSNGPGDPERCVPTIATVKALIRRGLPILGICLGNQILSLAAGGRTYKLPFGHRSQNQPCVEAGTGRCIVTSQNHGYAVSEGSLPRGWEPWWTNLNDGTIEGVRHARLPMRAVQFHPEARPGPVDASPIITEFARSL